MCMHMHSCMGTKTISLEDSAYGKLKAAKRPGESFSGVIHRLLGSREPSLLEFTRLLDRDAAEKVAEAIARWRDEDLHVQRRRIAAGR
jgi:predicted CopG family antitoxin